MSRKSAVRRLPSVVALCLTTLGAWYAFLPTLGSPPQGPRGNAAAKPDLEQRFETRVRPFLERYCHSCHGARKPKADLDLSRYASVKAIVHNPAQWELVLERLQAGDMP